MAATKPRAGLLRRGLSWTFRRVMAVYFRSIEVAGVAPSEATGGRIFVSNHVNALVDPILVLTTAPCPISPVAKSTLWGVPGMRLLLGAVSAVPIVRRRDDPDRRAGANDEAFDTIAEWLAAGGNILIFPEGTSHSEPKLMEVKSGAARMLARAQERGGKGLSLQAVALEFDERHLFRSRALLLYGPVRFIDDFTEEGEAKVAALTAALREDLKSLLVEGATWPDRVLIARVAEMLANDAGERTLAGWNSIGREVAAAEKALRSGREADVARIRTAVFHYYAGLSREGVTDAELTSGDTSKASIVSSLLLFLLLPLAALGTIAYFVPYQLPRFVAGRVTREQDEVSTYKLGVGLVVYPLWALLLAVASLSLLSSPASWIAMFSVFVAPFAALAWLDRTPQIARSIRARTRARAMRELSAARAEVMSQVAAVRADLGV